MFEAQTPSAQMPGIEGEQRNPATGRCSEGPPATPCVDLANARGEGGASGNLKHQDFEKDRCLNHRAVIGRRWRMTQTCSTRRKDKQPGEGP